LTFIRWLTENEGIMTTVPQRLVDAPKSRIWYYKPELYWFGWRALVPWARSHDEYSRETLVLGWNFAGRIIIALGYCGDEDCYEQSVSYLDWLIENPDVPV
jgi:hypothetical protein